MCTCVWNIQRPMLQTSYVTHVLLKVLHMCDIYFKQAMLLIGRPTFQHQILFHASKRLIINTCFQPHVPVTVSACVFNSRPLLFPSRRRRFKLNSQIRSPSYHSMWWRKSTLINKISVQIHKTFHQHGISEKTKKT